MAPQMHYFGMAPQMHYFGMHYFGIAHGVFASAYSTVLAVVVLAGVLALALMRVRTRRTRARAE